LLGAASEAWFGYRGQRAALNELLQAESRSAADRIQTFIDGIRSYDSQLDAQKRDEIRKERARLLQKMLDDKGAGG